jgi:hypothetical protein
MSESSDVRDALGRLIMRAQQTMLKALVDALDAETSRDELAEQLRGTLDLTWDALSPETRAAADALIDRVLALVAPAPVDFDPRPYLMKMGARDYLEVKWRLVWLRTLHPDAIVVTELLTHPTELAKSYGMPAVFRATVTIPSTGAIGTGTGSETLDDHADFVEKAETKAIGRALATLGFGTQFTVERESVVDAPLAQPQARGATQPSSDVSRRSYRPPATAQRASVDAPTGADHELPPHAQRNAQRAQRDTPAAATIYASDYQKRRVEKLRVNLGMNVAELERLTREMFGDGATVDTLSVASCNSLISELDAGRFPTDVSESTTIAQAGERAASAAERELDELDALDDTPSSASRLATTQLAAISGLVVQLGATHDDLIAAVRKRYSFDDPAQMNEAQRTDLIEHLKARLAKRRAS